MRLEINLASRPYEHARQFWLKWGTGLALASIVTLALVVSTITGWYVARRDRATIHELRASIAQRDQLRAQAEEFLNRPENRTTRDQSQVINTLIERKAFSWTQLAQNGDTEQFDMEAIYIPKRTEEVETEPASGPAPAATAKPAKGKKS